MAGITAPKGSASGWQPEAQASRSHGHLFTAGLVPTLAPAGCVTLGKSLYLSECPLQLGMQIGCFEKNVPESPLCLS